MNPGKPPHLKPINIQTFPILSPNIYLQSSIQSSASTAPGSRVSQGHYLTWVQFAGLRHLMMKNYVMPQKKHLQNIIMIKSHSFILMKGNEYEESEAKKDEANYLMEHKLMERLLNKLFPPKNGVNLIFL
jgi:hypothetical protein